MGWQSAHSEAVAAAAGEEPGRAGDHCGRSLRRGGHLGEHAAAFLGRDQAASDEHRVDPGGVADVGERVGVEHDQVSDLSRLDGTGLVLPVQVVGRFAGGRAQGLLRRESVSSEMQSCLGWVHGGLAQRRLGGLGDVPHVGAGCGRQRLVGPHGRLDVVAGQPGP